jgi:hypothetical protein
MGGFIPPGGVCLGDTDGDGVDEACEMQQNQSCCMPGGACVMVPPTFCEQMGGIPLLGGACLGDINGNGMDDACEGQACCVPEDGSCYEELSYLCSQRGHVPKGLGTVCLGDNDKDGIDDICEPMELKFIQEPDTNRTGIDVMATNPNVLADDFLCTRRSLITHITVWGSWKCLCSRFVHGKRSSCAVWIPVGGSMVGTIQR